MNILKKFKRRRSPPQETQPEIAPEPITIRVQPEIKHFDHTHFAAITIGDRKFVYCPVGEIISWNAGDYDHRYCAYCKKYFTDIGGQTS